MSRLTSAQIKYLHAMYMLWKGNGCIRAVDVAQRLNVAKKCLMGVDFAISAIQY